MVLFTENNNNIVFLWCNNTKQYLFSFVIYQFWYMTLFNKLIKINAAVPPI